MTPAQRRADHAAGADWFKTLDTSARWDLGDALVLGDFEWFDWGFERKPSPAFMNGVEDARSLWEQSA